MNQASVVFCLPVTPTSNNSLIYALPSLCHNAMQWNLNLWPKLDSRIYNHSLHRYYIDWGGGGGYKHGRQPVG